MNYTWEELEEVRSEAHDRYYDSLPTGYRPTWNEVRDGVEYFSIKVLEEKEPEEDVDWPIIIGIPFDFGYEEDASFREYLEEETDLPKKWVKNNWQIFDRIEREIYLYAKIYENGTFERLGYNT